MNQLKIPLHIQIREFLIEQIETGLLQQGDQIPTEAELMARFNVSRVTISTAIKHLVKEGLVYRIAGKGTFVKSSENHQPPENELLRDPHVKMIGFIAPPFRSNTTYNLLYGIEEACRERGFLLLIRTVYSQTEEQTAIQEMLAAGVIGLIIWPTDGETYNEEMLKLRSIGFPFVLVDRYLPGIQTNAVYSDHYNGGVIGTEHLFQLGHQKIGIVSSPKSKTTSSDERFQGYLDFARDHKLKVEPRHWLTRLDDEIPYHEEINSMDRIRTWLEQNPDITAVFAINSLDALYVAKVAALLKLDIPNNLAILSFDDPGVKGILEDHFFSFIEQNLEKVGEQAVNLLFDAIKDPNIFQQIKVPVSLRVGRSTVI